MPHKRLINPQNWLALILPIGCLSLPILPTWAETTSSAEPQSQPALEPEPLQRQTLNNLQFQEAELKLRNSILNLKQQQTGISDTTKPIGLGQSGTTFGNLTTVPIESKILVFQSSGEVAQIIARDISQVAKESELKSIVVYSQREFAKLNGYRLYNSIRKGLVLGYKAAGIALEKPKPGGSRDIGSGPGALQTSTTVLKSAAELLSYFRSEDVINVNEFTPTGQSFLVAQLMSALRQQKSPVKVYAPSIYLMNFERLNGVIETFLGDLNELSDLKSLALAQMAQTSDPQKIQRLVQLNQQADLLLNLLKETDFQAETIKSSGGPPSSGSSSGSQIFQLIQGAEISLLLNSRDQRVLVVDLLASGGSTRTRRSLFSTMFTGQGISYSGGVAVQYFLVNPDNSLAAGDVIYRSSGFKTMRGPMVSDRSRSVDPGEP